MKTYLVGGAVRDKLLKLPVKDRDWVVVGATAEEMLDAGYTQVGKDFPVFLHPETKEEYALARTERKTAQGYHGFEFDTGQKVTLEQDLARRDLTINAMAETQTGRLVDPFNGHEDLQNGLLRHISPAFAEDPVRILRVARFAARYAHWGFRVAHGTNALMRKMVAQGEVDALVPERVWAETVKALTETTPGRYFKVLQGCDALEKIFPEIAAQFAALPKSAHGVADLDEVPALQALTTVSAASGNPAVRFAALCSRLGSDEDSIGQRRQIIQHLCQRLAVPNQFRDLALTTLTLCATDNENFASTAEQVRNLLKQVDALRKPDRFSDALLICAALVEKFPAERWRRALQACQAIDTNAFRDTELTGPQIGEKIRELQTNAIEKVL